jgi:pimeloyl-ACP methyl ester carboxylesterase
VKHVVVGPEGARLGYAEKDGEGRTVVLLHGLGASSPVYFAATAAAPEFARCRVLMVDLLGFGISDRPRDFGYTLEEQADAVARGLDALGLFGVDVVGHSMGGSIALILATRRPDLVARVVLAEPNLRPTPRPRVEPFTESAFVDHGFAQALEAVGPDWAATMRLADPVAVHRSELALGRANLLPLLADLTMPCTLVEGEHTGELVADPEIQALGLPVVVVPGAGHVMMLDNPIGFATAVSGALDLRRTVLPVPDGTMPASVPAGMRLELSRARLLPGAQAETERWMGMLHERYEECLDTLSAERMAFEATFRHTDADGTEWIYHLQLSGDEGGGLDLSNPVDAEHQAYAMRCKEPGWEELRPVLLLAPRPVRQVMQIWARDGDA